MSQRRKHNRKQDLEGHIRESYNLIREYEEILPTSDRPKEKTRARRNTEEQWALIGGYLDEYLPLCQRTGSPIAPDVQEIAVRFEKETDQQASPQAEAPGRDTKYSIQIKHAEGIAIGDGARVVQPPVSNSTNESSDRTRRMARRALAILEEQAAGYTHLTIPTHLQIELEEKRRQVAELESRLDTLPSEEGRSNSHLRGDPSPTAASQEPPGPIQNRWALLVGVNRYVDPAFPPLKFCVNDVLALESALKTLGYTVVALHDDASEERLLPTRDNVEAELTRLCQIAGSDDLILVHIACHGKLVDGKPVLVTRETRAPTLARKALPLADVEQVMRESKARRLVLTLDACHTGVEVGRDLADPEFIRNAYELAEGFVLIAASTAQQIAQEWEEKAHGVFTYYLLEGLSGRADRDGKRFVTVGDLSAHVLDGLRRWNVEHGGLLQEPTARAEGLGDIILADYRGHTGRGSGVVSAAASTVAPNPFGDVGRIVDPHRFFDREEILRQILEELTKGANLSLVGESQVGKSSLLSMVCALGPERMDRPTASFGYLSMQWVDSEDGFYEALCDTLGIETCRGYQLHRALRGQRHVLCLDEIEKMSWEGFTERLRSQLRGLADGPAAPLRLVIASRSPLSQLFPDSPELDSPLAGICRPVDVGPFPAEMARAFLADRLRGSGVTFSPPEVDALLEETGGHPARLQRAAADLYRSKNPGFF